jgi:hypothetical protein
MADILRSVRTYMKERDNTRDKENRARKRKVSE